MWILSSWRTDLSRMPTKLPTFWLKHILLSSSLLFYLFVFFKKISLTLILTYDQATKDSAKDQRERVLTVFQRWLEIQPEDFQTLGEVWDRFLSESVAQIDGKSWVKDLQMAARTNSRVSAPILEDNTSSPSRTAKKEKAEKLPKSIIPRGKNFGLDDLDPVEIARQLTLIDYELFQRIRPSEFNNLAWTKKNKEVDAPNLIRMIRRFNDVWVPPPPLFF